LLLCFRLDDQKVQRDRNEQRWKEKDESNNM